MSPGIIPPTGLTAAAAAAAAATNAAIAEAMKVKKIKLEAMSNYHASNNQHGADSENGDMNSSVGLELPFMMMPHPLIPVSLPPASVTMAMSQMNHLSTIANMAAAAQVQSPPSRVETSVIKERVPDSPSPAPSLEEGRRPGSHPSSHRSSSVSSSPARTESSSDRIPVHQNGLSMNQMLMGLSPNVLPGPKEGDLAGHDMGHESKRMHIEKDETPLSTPTARDSLDKLSLTGHGQPLPPGFPSPFLFPDGLSSIETLLTNIQGLLKVAIDNARAQEKQVQLEKTELKMDFLRERELRETLEKQLAMEQKNRAIVQKRLKKEKKAKRKLQEALEFETKRREQAEQTLKQAASTDSLRVLNDSLTPEIEADRSGGRTDAERTIQDETPLSTPTARDSLDKLSLTGHGQPLPPGFPSPFLFPDGLSSIETLLTNIQGLLKVAIDNARAQEKQVQLEKTELKMDFLRERELRETLEKQLAMEQKNRAIVQKRLKKEKKAKRKLQEALEFETKRREQAEQTLKQAASTDSLRVLNDSLTPEIEADRSGGRTDAERTIQDGRLYLKTTVMY